MGIETSWGYYTNYIKYKRLFHALDTWMWTIRFSFLDGNRDTGAGRHSMGAGLRHEARGSRDSLRTFRRLASDLHGTLFSDDAVSSVSAARSVPHGWNLRLEDAGGLGNHETAPSDDGRGDREFASVKGQLG